MSFYQNQSKWEVVSKQNPCPKCGKPDRCKISPDGRAGYCFRQEKTWRDSGGDDGTSSAGTSKPRPPSSDSPGDALKAHMERFRAAMTDERRAELAAATGIPASAWSVLAPGWATKEQLRDLHAGGAGWKENPPEGAFVFAENDGEGRIVGLSLRAIDGRKGGPAKSKRGLIVPTNFHQLADPVLVVEGASDVAACAAMSIAAIGRSSNRAGSEDVSMMLDGRAMLIVGERDGKPEGGWPGRDGAKHVARRVAARLGDAIPWTLPPVGSKDIRDWLKAKFSAGLSVEDEAGLRQAGRELLSELEKAAKVVKPEKRTQADAIVDLALELYRLGRDTDGSAFCVPIDGPNVAIYVKALRPELANAYRKATGKIAGSTSIGDAIVTLEGMAQDLPREQVALRVAEKNSVIVLDLGDETGRAIKISKDGWSVESKSEILFRRTALTGVLPLPSSTAGDLEADTLELLELRKIINVDETSWGLIVGYLVAALMPEIPHPVMMLGGEQGSGKSNASDRIVGVIDPSPALRLTQPQQPRQWVICAAARWVVPIDNVSGISPWLSDAICKCVTGDGWVDRKLYSDSDLTVLSFRRCVIFTSIDPGALRGDLGDRLMILDLKTIKPELRRPERELNEAFDEMRPRLMKAILAALVLTLRTLPTISLKELPRMADFARVLGALDLACPQLTGGAALKTFMAQRGRIAEEVVESDPVAAAIVRFMDSKTSWSGPAGDLLTAISPSLLTPGWPRNARTLVARLNRVRPALAQIGILHTKPAETDKTRTHRLDKAEAKPPIPPEPPEADTGPESEEPGSDFEESFDFPANAGSAMRAGM